LIVAPPAASGISDTKTLWPVKKTGPYKSDPLPVGCVKNLAQNQRLICHDAANQSARTHFAIDA